LEVSVAAIHKVKISEGDISVNLARDPNWTSLTIDYLLEITENLYLIDLKVSDLGLIDDMLMEVTQENEHEQAPFAEMYFEITGKTPLKYEDKYDSHPPEGFKEAGHVRFFMHYFDPNLELEFNGEKLLLPAPTPLPMWLKAIMPYQPPN
jgi:hypothetical protein